VTAVESSGFFCGQRESQRDLAVEEVSDGAVVQISAGRAAGQRRVILLLYAEGGHAHSAPEYVRDFLRKQIGGYH